MYKISKDVNVKSEIISYQNLKSLKPIISWAHEYLQYAQPRKKKTKREDIDGYMA